MKRIFAAVACFTVITLFFAGCGKDDPSPYDGMVAKISMTAGTAGQVDFNLSGSGEVTVLWGDGQSRTETLSGAGKSFSCYADATHPDIHITGPGSRVTGVDISGCTTLTGLYYIGGQLAGVDVGGCTALEILYCSDNDLTVLDVSGCAALKYLNCSGNLLTGLDVSGNTALKELNCSYNRLTGLNFTGCASLIWVWCYKNQLTALDISTNLLLQELICCNNRLTGLDATGLDRFMYADISSNHFTGEKLDALFETLNSSVASADFVIGDKRVFVSNNGGSGGVYNPDGTSDCDYHIAEDKYWSVVYTHTATH